ncbi:glyoxalase superfamily protein [Flavobacterium hydatis]|uniref:Bleomycin resistance protein n=1 Tax=Flavobacterium hydatis TaxID=991 RepID=A0A086AI80_FLAHY|nr:glyoxalase/bleomycin resistance/extradiol dioxygenase family protein [Flavobacterium hydatis]KFF16394.1 bleomycin resistance protein [Flavobacterium hydatis]OXA96590.1 glyoxalase/bleomycin resistance/extradiol dioxygenase family protein [Flavobacterium hydatis]
MAIIRPIFRIFDYKKAVEFYVDWLGFEILDEHTFEENSPLYIRISLEGIEIHLSEHHGDCSPGAKIIVEGFVGLKDYHQKLIQKNYKYNKPGIEKAFWNEKIYCVEVIDPFGNKMIFTGE